MRNQHTSEPMSSDIDVALLMKLDNIEQLLRDVLLDSEQEPDYDQTFIVGGTLAAASVALIGNLPRTITHVEIDFSITTPGTVVALLDGNVSLAQAQGQHNIGNTSPGASNAIAVTGGSEVTVRDYLGGGGALTVFFTAAYTGFAQVRIRNLDATQSRGQRT